jgi:hypothetical protein
MFYRGREIAGKTHVESASAIFNTLGGKFHMFFRPFSRPRIHDTGQIYPYRREEICTGHLTARFFAVYGKKPGKIADQV